MDKWRKIDTAPVDGTEFLAYDPVAKKFDVCAALASPWHHDNRIESTQLDGEFGPGEWEFRAERATHWHPIIAPETDDG